jgi:hypothetical protein
MGLAVKVDEDLPARVNGWAADHPPTSPNTRRPPSGPRSLSAIECLTADS